jgi:hypothetical protein
MNFFVKDGAFSMTPYGKPRKVLNIRRNPAGNAYSELRGVMVRGHCDIIESLGYITPSGAECVGVLEHIGFWRLLDAGETREEPRQILDNRRDAQAPRLGLDDFTKGLCHSSERAATKSLDNLSDPVGGPISSASRQ